MRAGREMPLDDTCEIRVENMWIIHQPAPKQSVSKEIFECESVNQSTTATI